MKKLLDELFIFLNFPLQDDWTPLHSAVLNSYTDVVMKLLESGADTGVKKKVRRFYLAEFRNNAFI